MAAINIWLRADQLRYLKHIADRDFITVSKAVALVMAEHAKTPSTRKASRKRRHIMISSEHLQVLDALATHKALTRSQIIRQLIDLAVEEDGLFSG